MLFTVNTENIPGEVLALECFSDAELLALLREISTTERVAYPEGTQRKYQIDVLLDNGVVELTAPPKKYVVVSGKGSQLLQQQEKLRSIALASAHSVRGNLESYEDARKMLTGASPLDSYEIRQLLTFVVNKLEAESDKVMLLEVAHKEGAKTVAPEPDKTDPSAPKSEAKTAGWSAPQQPQVKKPQGGK